MPGKYNEGYQAGRNPMEESNRGIPQKVVEVSIPEPKVSEMPPEKVSPETEADLEAHIEEARTMVDDLAKDFDARKEEWGQLAGQLENLTQEVQTRTTPRWLLGFMDEQEQFVKYFGNYAEQIDALKTISTGFEDVSSTPQQKKELLFAMKQIAAELDQFPGALPKNLEGFLEHGLRPLVGTLYRLNENGNDLVEEMLPQAQIILGGCEELKFDSIAAKAQTLSLRLDEMV